MSALDFAGTDGQARLNGRLVVELSRTVGQITVASADRRVFRGNRVRLPERREGRQDVGKPVSFQAVFLSFHPARVVGRANLGCSEVIADMEKVDLVLALCAKLSLHLIFNPDRAIAQSMDMTAFVEVGSQGQSQQVSACRACITQRDRKERRHFIRSSDHRQFSFFPENVARFASILRTVVAGLSRLNHRNHAAVDLGDQGQRFLRRASFRRHGRLGHPVGVTFRDRRRRPVRQVDAVMFANLFPNLSKRYVRTKISDGPL